MEFAVTPEGIDKRTKDGKAAFAEFQQRAEGRQILSQDQLIHVSGMAESVLDLLGWKFGSELKEHEPSFFWKDSVSSLTCKARPDIFIDGMEPMIVEIKTTSDGSNDAWFYKVRSMDYAIQAIHHIEGVKNVRGIGEIQYGWLVVENESPYAATIYWLIKGDRYELDVIRRENALINLRTCIASGSYPSYPEGELIW